MFNLFLKWGLSLLRCHLRQFSPNLKDHNIFIYWVKSAILANLSLQGVLFSNRSNLFSKWGWTLFLGRLRRTIPPIWYFSHHSFNFEYGKAFYLHAQTVFSNVDILYFCLLSYINDFWHVKIHHNGVFEYYVIFCLYI